MTRTSRQSPQRQRWLFVGYATLEPIKPLRPVSEIYGPTEEEGNRDQMDLRGKVVSADCHIDLIWLPPDLFTAMAPKRLRDRMPYVDRDERGRSVWVSKGGAYFGLVNGMGSAGREYVPGEIHRSDRMAAQGLYEDGQRGVRRLTDPELRVRDQELDGVRGEVLYGILGAANRLNDPEAAAEVMRIYNSWLAEFCASNPDRFAGIACIPNHDVGVAVAEIERVTKRGIVRGLEIANTLDMKPLYHHHWNPLWEAVDASGLPVHIHTIGGRQPEPEGLTQLEWRAAFATFITGFQLKMADKLMEAIYGGVLERYPGVRLVIGEAGIGWIPYVLEHMDLEWEDQFRDLELKMKPSEYWRRQCYATYQSDPIGIRLIDVLGEDNVMWGSDFPHPDGVWPDSQEFIAREMAGVEPRVQRKVLWENAARLYGFPAVWRAPVTEGIDSETGG
ncbi:MAG: amidohydrolase family protein [Rhodospirillales bacterium]|nr:amidohydrolase family protein [Rhodospirillales bacterium]